MGLLICLIYLYVFIEFKPFKNPMDNNLGIVLAYALTLLFIAALLQSTSALSQDSRDQHVFGALLTVCLFAGPACVAFQIGWLWYGTCSSNFEPSPAQQTSEQIEMQEIHVSDNQTESGFKTSQSATIGDVVGHQVYGDPCSQTTIDMDDFSSDVDADESVDRVASIIEEHPHDKVDRDIGSSLLRQMSSGSLIQAIDIQQFKYFPTGIGLDSNNKKESYFGRPIGTTL